MTFEPEQNGEQFLRLWVIGSKKQRLFTVDLTRIEVRCWQRRLWKKKLCWRRILH